LFTKAGDPLIVSMVNRNSGYELKQLKIVMAYAIDGLTRQIINGFDPTQELIQNDNV